MRAPKRFGMKFAPYGRAERDSLIRAWNNILPIGLVPTKTTRERRFCTNLILSNKVRAELRPIAIVESPEIVDNKFPFLLTTGRHLYQFNAGTMTQRTANVEIRARDELEISPNDAALLSLSTGDWVAMESRHGRCELPIRVAARIKQGELFTTFHDPTMFVNCVTSGVRDRLVHSPEYKVTAVNIAQIQRPENS